MADNEKKDVPIKEQADGSVLAKIEAEEVFDDEEEHKEGGKVEAEAADESDDTESEDTESEDEESDDERERIREAGSIKNFQNNAPPRINTKLLRLSDVMKS